ncbi:Aminopeptidase Y [Ascochyta rabiei]|uniref:Aminopeptidase Y n=1 Tax=Didymella rabiei TaxID=5454 RepID=UPI0021FAFBD4|nr:Aminopeptidase Y [Ascochyta rabiei]UPX20687.1 Aminopeptidase Y [Ascochyta rabiei]
MKFNNFEVLTTILCSWLSGFLLGLWRLTPYITDREAGLLVALSVVVAMVIIHKHLNKNAVVAYLNRHVGEVQNTMLLDLQEFHRKRVATLKINHNQTMREAQDEIRRLHAKFDRLNSEYDWISTMYQDQMRTNQEQEDRIAFLEVKLKEFGQLKSSASSAPFSAPASQINFANPPRRTHRETGRE